MVGARPGRSELATIALALENPSSVVLLDDALARRVAQAAGLQVWGTLRVALEAKQRGLVAQIGPVVEKLEVSGMWISVDIRARILALAGETER
jgi:predicted nucleic acid-binding protein